MSTKNIETETQVDLATDDQVEHICGNLTAEVVKRLPRNQAQSIITKGGDYQARLKQVIHELSSPKPVTQHPPIDEWFDLEIDNTVDPMSVVTTAVHDAKGWKYLGPPVAGKEIRRVKLIELGYVAYLEAARKAAKQKGYRLVEGQARQPFKAKFPWHGGRSIVFGGNEWQDPKGCRRVACLSYLASGPWYSDFDWSDPRRNFDSFYRWAVEQAG